MFSIRKVSNLPLSVCVSLQERGGKANLVGGGDKTTLGREANIQQYESIKSATKKARHLIEYFT